MYHISETGPVHKKDAGRADEYRKGDALVRSLLMLACLSLSLYVMSRMGEPIAGGWACASLIGSGTSSHSCAAEPGLQLKANHTYEWGGETGTWQYSRGALWFSHLRAVGRLKPDGKLITEYDRNGNHYVLTFYKWY